MRTLAGITLTLVFAVAGCGGSGASNSPEDQVRETARDGTAAMLSDHPERACKYMLDHEKCIGSVAALNGLDMEASAVLNVPDGWQDKLANADVRVDGDTAMIGDFTGDGKPGKYVRKDGKWLADNR